MSVLCGLVPPSYLDESVGRCQAGSLLYIVKTKVKLEVDENLNFVCSSNVHCFNLQKDRLDIQQSHVKRLINTECVLSSHATHVVVEIEWGSCSVVSITGSGEEGNNDLKVGVLGIFLSTKYNP